MAPEFGPQQVLGQVIWRLENARKPFSGRGSARTPRGGAYSTPRPQLVGVMAASSPRTAPPLLALWALDFGPLGFAPDPK